MEGSPSGSDDDESDAEVGGQKAGAAPQRSRAGAAGSGGAAGGSGNGVNGGGGSGQRSNAAGSMSAQDQQRVAAIEGLNSEVKKYLDASSRNHMRWSEDLQRYREVGVADEWKPWGKVPDNREGHLILREQWLTWMACTSRLLQTVDNRHLNRHLDYMYSGPGVHFVDLQTTPQIGRRLSSIAHLVSCINNLGELPLDCVVPTPETELLYGQGKACKTVRGMRMKNSTARASREVELSSVARSGEKWLKSFKRGCTYFRLHMCIFARLLD